MKDNSIQTLKYFCRNNGRYFEILTSGEVITADAYTGDDAQIFFCIADAIDWERGYTTASDALGRKS